jgi:3-carboxy-cis,cis-muconate cycloisomerase
MLVNLNLSGGLIMAESVATGLAAAIGRAAAEVAVERACSRAIAEKRPLAEILRDDSEIRAHLTDAEIERLTNPAADLGSAGAFVDRVVARIAKLA